MPFIFILAIWSITRRHSARLHISGPWGSSFISRQMRSVKTGSTQTSRSGMRSGPGSSGKTSPDRR